jgi:predicted MFS family arabinose efflux permease
MTIWIAGARLVPSLTAHLSKNPAPLARVVPDLLAMIGEPHHLDAYALTFIVMVSQMLVIPFISPVLVANHGIAPGQIAWIYMAGGAATFFSSRWIGRLADTFGKHAVFRAVALISILPVLFVTHLPNLPLIALVALFPIFMVTVSGRIIPMQALLTTVPVMSKRGAFLSINNAIQSLGTGCGAWLGGLLLATAADGRIEGYGTNGWIAAALVIMAIFWIGRVKPIAAVKIEATQPA